jgi:hypothetical protein
MLTPTMPTMGSRVRRHLGMFLLAFLLTAISSPHAGANELIFYGQGSGHGVGLSQYGAKAMALGGATYRQILHRYYTGVSSSRSGQPPAGPSWNATSRLCGSASSRGNPVSHSRSRKAQQIFALTVQVVASVGLRNKRPGYFLISDRVTVPSPYGREGAA